MPSHHPYVTAYSLQNGYAVHMLVSVTLCGQRAGNTDLIRSLRVAFLLLHSSSHVLTLFLNFDSSVGLLGSSYVLKKNILKTLSNYAIWTPQTYEIDINEQKVIVHQLQQV